jgi:hypothetical protein
MDKEYEWRTGRNCVYDVKLHLIKNIGTKLKTNYGVNTYSLTVLVLFPAVGLPWI